MEGLSSEKVLETVFGPETSIVDEEEHPKEIILEAETIKERALVHRAQGRCEMPLDPVTGIEVIEHFTDREVIYDVNGVRLIYRIEEP